MHGQQNIKKNVYYVTGLLNKHNLFQVFEQKLFQVPWNTALKYNLFEIRHSASSKHCSKCYTVSSRAEPVASNIKYSLEQKLFQVPWNTASSRTCSKYYEYVTMIRA